MKYDIYPGKKGYWRVWLDSPKDQTKFMGISKKRTDDFYTVQANLVNAIVLDDLSLVKLPNAPVEEDLIHKQLFDYQRIDVIKMIQKVRVLNANYMGYGKTIETIAALRAARIQKAIIIAPKPILTQWASQIDKWWPKHPEIFINPKQPMRGINLYNYEQTINEKRQTLLRSTIWDAVVVDESQRIKTPTTKRTLAANAIPAKYKFALTGTPILKTPEDLYSQLRFLNPLYSGNSFYTFRNYFCHVKTGFFGEEIKGLTKDEFHVKVLHKLLSIVAITNPEMVLAKGKIEVIEKLSMQQKQRKLYKDVVQLILDNLPKNATIANGAVRTLRAQQVTTCPSHFIKGTWGTKFEWIKMLLEDNPNEKIVVFSKFATAAKELQKYLTSNSIKCATYIGELNIPERHEVLLSFRDDPTLRVLVGTVACIGEGVDGLQHSSHIAVFLDRPYSPQIIKQCEDRLNRPGQQHKVLCYFLECAGTYDRHYGRVTEKRAEDIRRALCYDESDDS